MHEAPDRREKTHAVAGVVWPLLILGSVVALGRAARDGRDSFLPYAEARLGWAPVLLGLFVLALLVWGVTAGLTGLRFGREAGLRRLRRLLALPALGFALTHAWLVWGRVAIGGADGRALYVGLLQTLGQTTMAWLYAFGSALLALQLEQSLRVLGETFAFPRREREARWYAGSAIVLSVLLLFFAYDGLGNFVAGRPLFFGAPE